MASGPLPRRTSDVARGFKRSVTGRYVAQFEPEERLLLLDLFEQLSQLVEPVVRPNADPLESLVGIDPYAERPEDPALARLVPDAYDDDELADEFRRFTQRGLLEAKAINAHTVRDDLQRSGGKLTLSAEKAQIWATTLTDLRLTLATRIGLTNDADDDLRDLPADDPRAELWAIYDFLSWLQESLVLALMPELRSDPVGRDLLDD